MKLRLEKELGESSMRHGGEINMMAVAYDDSVLVAADGGQPGRAVVWDLASGAARTSVASRTYGFTATAISKDGKYIAVSGYDNRAVVFDATSGKRLHSFDTRAAAHAMAFSPDGKWLLVGDDRTPRLLSLGREEHRALKGHLSALKAAAFSPDGRFAATAAGDRKIKLQDVAKAKVLATMQGYASVVAFLANGTQLLYLGFDCGAIVEVPSGKPIRKLDLGFMHCAAVSGDGRRLAVRTGREETRIEIRDLESGEKIFDRAFDPVRLVALSHSGDRLVVARAAMLGQGTSLEVWSIPEGERLLPKGEGHLGGVAAVASYGAKGRRIAVSASADRTLKLWDVDEALEIETIAGGHDGIGALAVSTDG
ncbi:MAG: WD40 repeat domain-containing protein, partial [Polyangiales bacterium]